MAGTGKLTESTIQAAVWHVELGRGKVVVYWLLLTLLALVLSLVYTASEFRGLDKREAIDQAQVARNWAFGRGFTTYFIRPLSIWQLKQAGPDHAPRIQDHPDIVNPPLYPAVLGGLFRLLPQSVFVAQVRDSIYVPERWVILPFNQLCLLLSVLLVYCWGRQLFDQRVAVTAGLLLLFSDTLWQYGVSGLPTNLLTLLVLLAVFSLYRLDCRLNPVSPDDQAAAAVKPMDGAAIGWLLLSAVLVGLSCLTRYMAALFLLPPLLGYLAFSLRGRGPIKWLIVYAVVAAAVVAPWLVRNHQVAGHVFGIAHYALLEAGETVGGDTLARSADPDAKAALAGAWSLQPLAAKFVTGLRQHAYQSLAVVGSAFLLPFFLAGTLYGFRRPAVARLRGALIGLIVCAIGAMAAVGVRGERVGPAVHGDDLLVVLYPLLALFGVAFFFLLLDRIPFRIRLTRGLVVGVFGLLNVAPLVFTLLPPVRASYPYPPYFPPVTRAVAQLFGPDEIGCSDQPWSMAWYGDRRTVWLPLTVEEFEELHDYDLRAPGFSFLLLTPYMLDRPATTTLLRGEYSAWTPVIWSRLPARFPLRAIRQMPPGRDQYLLADRPRWNDPQFSDLFGRPQETPAGATGTTE